MVKTKTQVRMKYRVLTEYKKIIIKIPVKARFSAPVQTGPGVHVPSYTVSTGSLSRGVKRPGRGVKHPSHLAPRLKKE